jgi:hypothetical protein
MSSVVRNGSWVVLSEAVGAVMSTLGCTTADNKQSPSREECSKRSVAGPVGRSWGRRI